MNLTKEELAARLNGRELGDEISRDEIKEARNAGLIVIFGHSDDCIEFRGAFDDETYIDDSECVWITRKGIKRIDEDEQEVLERHDCMNHFMRGSVCVTTKYGEGDAGWHFGASFPHAKFALVEDGEPCGGGLVLSITDLPEIAL